jgi:hypothetical protein
MQVDGDVQETLFSKLKPFVTLRFGLWIADHDEPFHRSTSVAVTPLTVPTPTAVQSVKDMHDTPLKLEPPVRLGTGTIAHVDPLPISTSAPVA